MGALVGGTIGFASATFADPLRKWIFRQRLELAFVPGDGCLIETNVHFGPTRDGTGPVTTGEDAKRVRILVRNAKAGVVRGARAYLARVEVQSFEGRFASTGYADTLQLAWSGRGADRFDAAQIPHGVTMFIDVLSSREAAPNAITVETAHWPERHVRLFAEKGVYRLTIVVTAENAKPMSQRLVLSSNAHWQCLRMVSAG